MTEALENLIWADNFGGLVEFSPIHPSTPILSV